MSPKGIRTFDQLIKSKSASITQHIPPSRRLYFFCENSAHWSVSIPISATSNSLVSPAGLLTLRLPMRGSLMPSLRLSKTIVEKLQPKGLEAIFWDEGIPGFGVRVKESGGRSYAIQYRNREDGRSRRMTLGPHGPLLTYQQARDRARDILADALRGGNPAQDRVNCRRAPHMATLCDAYLKDHAEKKKRASSIKTDRSFIERFILPALGQRKVTDVGMKDIQKIHNGLSATRYQANRVLALSKMSVLPSAGAGAPTIRPSEPGRGRRDPAAAPDWRAEG